MCVAMIFASILDEAGGHTVSSQGICRHVFVNVPSPTQVKLLWEDMNVKKNKNICILRFNSPDIFR